MENGNPSVSTAGCLPHLVKKRVPSLPWPHNLYKDYTAAVVTTAPLYRKKSLSDGTVCEYVNCSQKHNNAVCVTKTINGRYKVFWFCCGTHRRQWEYERPTP
jgi:hypothetical protein